MIDPLAYGAIALVIVSIITGYFAWKGKQRDTSGSVDTSQAATIFLAAENYRKEIETSRMELKKEVADLKDQLILINGQLIEQFEERGRLLSRLEDQEVILVELKAHVLEIEKEIKTGNTLTIGEMADNTESRRIEGVPINERTNQENAHIDHVGENLKEDGLQDPRTKK